MFLSWFCLVFSFVVSIAEGDHYSIDFLVATIIACILWQLEFGRLIHWLGRLPGEETTELRLAELEALEEAARKDVEGEASMDVPRRRVRALKQAVAVLLDPSHAENVRKSAKDAEELENGLRRCVAGEKAYAQGTGAKPMSMYEIGRAHV